MSKVSRWLFCPFLLDAMLAPAALGCGADPLAALHGPGFEDNFKKPSPLWYVDGKSGYFADGQLVLKPDAGRATWAMIDSFRFSSALYCVDVKMPPEPAPGSRAGLVFGKVDSNNYFTALISPDGNWSLNQVVNNSLKVIRDSRLSSEKFKPRAVNEIKVRLKPGPFYASKLYVRMWINGEIVGNPDVEPVVGGFGAFAWSGADKAGEWRFLNVTATAASNPEGKYKVTGAYPGGARYAGTVSVSFNNFARGSERYDVGWNVDGKEVNGEVFSVTYPTGGSTGVAPTRRGTGVAAYVVSATGLSGQRTNPAQDARIATETWVRQPP